MSKEKKFHQLIEQIDAEEKKRVWAKIQGENSCVVAKEGNSSKPIVGRFSWRKIFAVCAITIAFVGVGILGTIHLFFNDVLPNSPSTSDPNDNRYCDSSMYSIVLTDTKLKEVANLGDGDILYLDWYDVTDYWETGIYELNEEQQIIGYYEKIVDINTGSIISIQNVYKEYQLEGLDIYTNTNRTEIVNGVELHIGETMDYSYANFSYGKYNYFVIIEYPVDANSILEILNELLS